MLKSISFEALSKSALFSMNRLVIVEYRDLCEGLVSYKLDVFPSVSHRVHRSLHRQPLAADYNIDTFLKDLDRAPYRRNASIATE